MRNLLIALVCSLSGILIIIPLLSASEVRVLSKADNGKDIQVKVGDIIELSLEEQGGTGYTWEFDQLDKNHFEVIKSSTTPLAEKTRVGGPVLKTWQLKAQKAGETKLGLDYFRPWEGKGKAAEHYLVKVVIQ